MIDKPRLIKWLGIWYCACFKGDRGYRTIDSGRVGEGYTPAQAYQDWLSRNH